MAILLIYRSLPFSGLILFFGLQWFAAKPEVSKDSSIAEQFVAVVVDSIVAVLIVAFVLDDL